MSMKNSNDTIGNRTRNLPTSSAVPQPTAPPLAPDTIGTESNSEQLYIPELRRFNKLDHLSDLLVFRPENTFFANNTEI